MRETHRGNGVGLKSPRKEASIDNSSIIYRILILYHIAINFIMFKNYSDSSPLLDTVKQRHSQEFKVYGRLLLEMEKTCVAVKETFLDY